MTHNQAKKQFLLDMELRNFSDCTVKAYRIVVNRFLKQTTKSHVEELNEKDFRVFLLQLHHQQSLSKSSMNM